MSERIDWIPVAIWSGFVAIQASSAIYKWWTRRRVLVNMNEYQNQLQKQLRATEYEKIMRGEKVDGWKLCKFDSVCDRPWWPFYRVVPPLWPRNGNDAPVDSYVLVVMKSETRSPNGNNERVYILRRYSLIAPGLYDDIVQITYDHFGGWPIEEGWRPIDESYIDESVVAIWWQRDGTNEVRIVLVEIESKSYQILETTLPHQNASVRAVFEDADYRHLMVLLRVRHDDNNATFHLVEYEISPSENIHLPIVHQGDSWDLNWHQGAWSFSSTLGLSEAGLSFPGAFYEMHHFMMHDARVVTLDRDGFDELDDKDDWVAEFMSTPIGLRMTETKESLMKMVTSDAHEDQPYGLFSFKLHRSHLFACVAFSSYVHRPLAPPSLKYLAAEAFCLAHPNFDFADLKNVIGFDIFDGLLDEKKPAVIRM